MQPDDLSKVFQEGAVFLPEDGPAAGIQNDPSGCCKPAECFSLEFPKVSLALVGENLSDAFAHLGGDNIVAVEEFMSQSSGKPSTEGALSASHETDEDDVWIHVTILGPVVA